MQRIISKDNKLIKHIKKLKEKKHRDEAKEYIIEGVKLIDEAMNENAKINQIVVCEGCESSGLIETHLKYEMAKYDLVLVPENIFKVILLVFRQNIRPHVYKISNNSSIFLITT